MFASSRLSLCYLNDMQICESFIVFFNAMPTSTASSTWITVFALWMCIVGLFFVLFTADVFDLRFSTSFWFVFFL